MNANEAAYRFEVKFPGNLEYIPAVRKFVSETLLANNFDPKFAYRSEIIVDEICNNAVSFGCVSVDATVGLQCLVYDDRIEFEITDEGGKAEDLKRLTEAVRRKPQRGSGRDTGRKDSLGLEIVRMLSDEITYQTDANNLTTVRVVKLREEDGGSDDERAAR